MKQVLLAISLFVCFHSVLAQQSGVIYGTVIEKNSQKPIAGATISVNQLQAVTNEKGMYRLNNIVPATYNITVKTIGFSTTTKYNVVINSGNEAEVNFELENATTELAGVTVTSSTKKSVKAATLETPLSVQRMTTEEIKANPGGNFDISKVIQSLPGVGGGVAGGGFRNDILIRGGAPNENVFYVDGIELPTINHFATQGAGGGPQGILNVSFIEDLKLSTSAFDTRFDNALSSVFEFKQKRGNSNQLQGNVRLSATELAGTLEGPLNKGKNPTTFLASARRSYLQLLFSALDLPIRPNYWDFQFKTTTQLNSTTTLTLLGVGAIDRFSFAAPKEATPEKLYSISSNPAVQQNSYTVGGSIKKLLKNGYWNLAISRNLLDNQLDRYSNNLAPSEATRNLKLRSIEAENKLRFDVNKNFNGLKLAYGFTAQLVKFTNTTFSKVSESPLVVNNFNSNIQFGKMGAFVQLGKRFIDNRLGLSIGIRSDINTFTNDGTNALQTLSPRFSINYMLADKWNVSASIGRYAKLASYTILGFKDNYGNFANKNASYTISNHYVAGFEHLPSNTLRFTLEGFYKTYNHVP
ncbi:MAG: TonB-dependent receptor, partial [Chitinophagaceae bacterium]